MSAYETLEAKYYEWVQEPEPPFPERDPRTVLDCNISGQAWLWNTHNESESWLVYNGEPVDLMQ